MRCITRSSRRRISRSRLSRSIRRPAISSRRPRIISKRRTSRLEHSAGFEAISRELDFNENAGCNRNYIGSQPRVQHRQILQKEQTTLPLNSDKDDVTCNNNSLKHDDEDDDLAQVQLVPGDDNRIVESMFGEIFDDASLLKVEVEQCVSLPELRTRPLRSFGVQKAIHLLRGKSIGSVTGHVCVGKFPVIAELPGEYEEKVLEYFCGQGRDREASKRYISNKKVYHVVNGGYEHEGRWRLIDEGQYQFSGIKWRTVQIKWQEPKVLRAISIMSSQVQKKEFVVELSFLDEMVYLRRVIQDYVNEHAIILDPSKPLPRGFCKGICKAYGGGAEYSNNTLRHLVSIASKLNMRSMLLIREAIDEECPRIAGSIHRKEQSENPSNILDTRVFRTLINSKTLRGAKYFLAAETIDEDRLNALYRLRYIAQERGVYKGVDAKTLEAQLDAAVTGRKTIENFKIRILQEQSWPVGMGPLLQNILRTTKLDSEIEEITGDPDKLLESLKMKYLDSAGAEGGCRVEQYEKFVQDRMRAELNGIGINGNNQEPEVVSPSAIQSPSSNRSSGELNDDGQELCGSFSGSTNDGQDLLASVSRSEDVNREVQLQRTSELPSQDDISPSALNMSPQEEDFDYESSDHPLEPVPEKDVLEQLNIEVHRMNFEEYNRTVLTEQESFDLVISEPFQKAASTSSLVFSTERRISFIQFIKKVLVPGGHAFLILPQLEMSEWLEAFDNFEMKTESIFLLLKDPEHVQRVKGKSFQNLMEVAAVARKSGRHTTRFTMDTVSPYTQLPRNTYKRKAPVIDHISPPSNRLRFPGSKVLVRTGEKSPALFWELMKTFCPAGGKLLDPFAATFTVGIAAIQTGRSCVLLESDPQCFSLAEARLRELATKNLQDGTALESSLIAKPVELEKKWDGHSHDTGTQEQAYLDDVHGGLDTEAPIPSSAYQDSEDNPVEKWITEEEKRGVPRELQCNADSVRHTDEVGVSREDPLSRGAHTGSSAEQCEPDLREEVPNVTTSHPDSTCSPRNQMISANEPVSNEKDSITMPVHPENNISGADDVLVDNQGNTNQQKHVNKISKTKPDTGRGSVKDLRSSRPRRNRKKTSRYA